MVRVTSGLRDVKFSEGAWRLARSYLGSLSHGMFTYYRFVSGILVACSSQSRLLFAQQNKCQKKKKLSPYRGWYNLILLVSPTDNDRGCANGFIQHTGPSHLFAFTSVPSATMYLLSKSINAKSATRAPSIPTVFHSSALISLIGSQLARTSEVN